MPMPDPRRPLRRSTRLAMFGGVCAGLALWLGWDVTLVRALVVVLAIATGFFPVLIGYVVFWMIMPPDESL